MPPTTFSVIAFFFFTRALAAVGKSLDQIDLHGRVEITGVRRRGGAIRTPQADYRFRSGSTCCASRRPADIMLAERSCCVAEVAVAPKPGIHAKPSRRRPICGVPVKNATIVFSPEPTTTTIIPMSAGNDASDAALTPGAPTGSLRGCIELVDLSFGYDKRPVLRGITMSVRARQDRAIMGAAAEARRPS